MGRKDSIVICYLKFLASLTAVRAEAVFTLTSEGAEAGPKKKKKKVGREKIKHSDLILLTGVSPLLTIGLV